MKQGPECNAHSRRNLARIGSARGPGGHEPGRATHFSQITLEFWEVLRCTQTPRSNVPGHPSRTGTSVGVALEPPRTPDYYVIELKLRRACGRHRSQNQLAQESYGSAFMRTRRAYAAIKVGSVIRAKQSKRLSFSRGVITAMRKATRSNLLRSLIAFFVGFMPLLSLLTLTRSRAQAPSQTRVQKKETNDPSQARPPAVPGLAPKPGDAPKKSGPRRQTAKDFETMHDYVLQIYSAIEQDWLDGKSGDLEVVYQWSRRALRARLRMSSKKDDRLAAIQAFLDRATKIKDAAHKRLLKALADARGEQKTAANLDDKKSQCYYNIEVELYMYELTGENGGWAPLEPIE
jgi:hypothetical protein